MGETSAKCWTRQKIRPKVTEVLFSSNYSAEAPFTISAFVQPTLACAAKALVLYLLEYRRQVGAQCRSGRGQTRERARRVEVSPVMYAESEPFDHLAA